MREAKKIYSKNKAFISGVSEEEAIKVIESIQKEAVEYTLHQAALHARINYNFLTTDVHCKECGQAGINAYSILELEENILKKIGIDE